MFENNVLLTQTERLMMSSRPKHPKYARNKNVLVIGGSGSGKTRFFVKPNLMQMHSSYVVTDPKGTVLIECGKLLQRGGYKIKVLNTINFKKSMRYNPFAYSISDEQKARIKIIREHYDFVEKLIAKVDTCVNEMVEKYEGEINLLCTIPGVDRNSAITIISEIGADMSQFGSSKRLCCWAGLTPGNNESAGKKKSVRISRAGVYLKPALVQVAHAAVKDKTNPYYALKYERIAKRRGKKRAIIAIARMILTAIYTMLCTGEVWNPVDLFKIDMPEHLKEQQLAKAIKQATRFLEKQGLTVA